MDLLAELAAGTAIDKPVAMVVAHQDDEVLGLGSRMDRLHRLKVIHLTDGAPRDLRDARREGFSTWQDYAAARRAELRRAMETIGAGGAEAIAYDAPDQEAIRHWAEIVGRLSRDLRGMRAVLTHPYEYGHPDHDTAALAVWLACDRLRAAGAVPPERFEFASYHVRDGRTALAEFWPDPGSPEIELRLSEDELARKRAARDCFDTQKALGGRFPLTPERVRRAPDYDFSAPAPPGEAVYDRWELEMTSAEWRRLADEALRANGAEARA
jgi:LmbE family N-acetylglucosaminyl deacetylase